MGIPVAPYHFHRFAATASVQAAFFKAHVTTENLPPVLDVEDTTIRPRSIVTATDYQNALPIAKSALGQIRDCLAAVADIFGEPPFWYSGAWYTDWMTYCWSRAGLDLSWMDRYPKYAASYTATMIAPKYWNVSIWQNSDRAIIPGIGACDHDIWMHTDSEFDTWIQGHGGIPIPGPLPPITPTYPLYRSLAVPWLNVRNAHSQSGAILRRIYPTGTFTVYDTWQGTDYLWSKVSLTAQEWVAMGWATRIS